MKRRNFLAMTLSFTGAGIIFSGCGSGGGGGDPTPTPTPSSTPTPTPRTLATLKVERSVVAGDLRAQIEVFNEANARLGDTWQGNSPALEALKGIVTRALPGVRAPLQATAIGLDATRVAFERLANQTLFLDDLGFVAGSVSQGNNLQGTSNLDNPTWLAGMFAQNIASLQVTGALYSILQVSGLAEIKNWVLTRTDAPKRLLAYAVAADIINTWVDAVCAATGTVALPAWKLSLGAEVTEATTIATQLDKLSGIALALPYGLGNRTGTTQDDAALGAGLGNFGTSLLGALTARVFSGATPSNLDPALARYNLATRLASQGILTNLGDITVAQAQIDTWLGSTNPDDWLGGNLAAINCQIQIVATSYGYFNVLRASMMDAQSVFGAIILSNQAIVAFDAMEAALTSCGSTYQLALWARQACARKILRDFRFINGSVVTERKVSDVSITSVEHDQVGYANINRVKTKLCIEIEANQRARGLNTLQSRTLIAGSGSLAAPRSFVAINNAAANLLFDLTDRFQTELAGEWQSDGSFTFVPVDFAAFIRREPGAQFATIPAITQAALLCAGPGFLPSRSSNPMNLATMASLPTLTALSNFVGGVPVHVN
jgi:hypothetical protein